MTTKNHSVIAPVFMQWHRKPWMCTETYSRRNKTYIVWVIAVLASLKRYFQVDSILNSQNNIYPALFCVIFIEIGTGFKLKMSPHKLKYNFVITFIYSGCAWHGNLGLITAKASWYLNRSLAQITALGWLWLCFNPSGWGLDIKQCGSGVGPVSAPAPILPALTKTWWSRVNTQPRDHADLTERRKCKQVEKLCLWLARPVPLIVASPGQERASAVLSVTLKVHYIKQNQGNKNCCYKWRGEFWILNTEKSTTGSSTNIILFSSFLEWNLKRPHLTT